MEYIERLPNWLRWILCPIASVLALVVVNFFSYHILRYSSAWAGFGPDSLYFLFTSATIVPATVGFMAVVVGVQVAPSSKLIVAIVLALVYAVVGGFGVVVSFLAKDWYRVTSFVMVIVGLGAAVYHSSDESKQV